MFSSNTTQESGGYEIQRSLRFNSADSAYLNRTPGTAGNRRTWTWSGWVKRSSLTYVNLFAAGDGTAGNRAAIDFDSDQVRVIFGDGASAVGSTQVFRDPSAWYHFVFAVDTTQATASDRVKLYVNGSQITALSLTSYPAQNYDTFVNATNLHVIGARYRTSADFFFNGYMTEVNFIDGQALTPSSFGAFDAQTGVWGPTRYAGSYGTNGFYLNFSDNSNTTAATLGRDYSGNSNNWTPNNFSVSAGAGNDSLVDVPTNWGTDTGVGGTVRGNYCTLNPLTFLNATFANGNLDTVVSVPETSNAVATFGVSSGKWYWEVTPTSTNAGMIGVCDITASASSRSWQSANGWAYFSANGNKYNNNSAASYGATYTNNDVIGVALDMDAGTLVFYKNGTSQGTAYSTGLSGKTITAYLGNGNGIGGAAQNYTTNFGQRPFAYTAPSGFKALNTQNLPTPTIGATTATQAGKFFNPVLYTGTGASSQPITGVGFAPDLVWIKSRSAVTSHSLFDTIRGAQKWLGSNATTSEQTYAGTLDAFGSDGFTVGNDAWTGGGNTYVAWNWKANGTGVTNTAGSITSTVSANTTSGFSVVTYTGTGANATVGHGLGAAPRMIIIKNRSSALGWPVYHASLGTNGRKFLFLNTTDAVADDSIWNSTNPTSTVFSLGAVGGSLAGWANGSGNNLVAYCFAEVPGYSRFGSYNGNSSSDGPFVFCGFRPAYVMVKLSSSGGTADWIVEDGTRNPYNVADAKLSPNTSGAEYVSASDVGIDFLSNGFKIRGTDGSVNTANTYIFAAFASAPQKFALAR